MGNQGSRKSRVSDHLAFSLDEQPLSEKTPHIVVHPPSSPSPQADIPPWAITPAHTATPPDPDYDDPPPLPVCPPPPLPTPVITRSPSPQPRLFSAPPIRSILSFEQPEPPRAPSPPPREPSSTPPPEILPPPPPLNQSDDDDGTTRSSFLYEAAVAPPTKRQNIVFDRSRLALFENGGADTSKRRENSSRSEGDNEKGKRESTSHYALPSTGKKVDKYPIYNPVENYSFQSGRAFQKGAFPVDANRVNIAIVGRQGAGKSTLINVLRGLNAGDAQAAGRHPCDRMEPFRFVEESLQQLVLWEVPYPRTFTSVSDFYDRNMSFNRFYDEHKLGVFLEVFVLVPDGSPSDDDLSFCRVVKSRRSSLSIILSRSDIDLDAEARELSSPVDQALVDTFASNARRIFNLFLEQKAQVLLSVPVLIISSPVIRNLVSGTRGFLHYKIDEEKLLNVLSLPIGCHLALEEENKRQAMTMGFATRAKNLSSSIPSLTNSLSPSQVTQKQLHKPTILADAGFEILFGTDDRVFGKNEPLTTTRRAGRFDPPTSSKEHSKYIETSFNYAFVGGPKVGKSSLINAMRGMTTKYSLAAGKNRSKPGSCEKFEFDDEDLKYSVALWELHYPRSVNNFFEFIDKHNIASFTAVFIVIKDGVPSDEDLAFSKIAHRRTASVLLLSSKSDVRLSSRSRADEIPVCDLLKQRFIDKGIARFDRRMSLAASELAGRVHLFFVSAPVFLALRSPSLISPSLLFILHERAVFDFLKQKRIIADMLEFPAAHAKEGLYANVNLNTAGMYPEEGGDDDSRSLH